MTVLQRGVLEDGRHYSVFESLATSCLLGLRFWDAVTDDQIRAGLRVRAWPLPARRPVVEALRTVSDIYAFHRLPGARDLEQAVLPSTSTPSPAQSRSFVVEARDLERRFLPAAFTVDLPLPHRGVYLPPTLGSPAAAPFPGFYLFSSPVRSRPPGVAAVRAELIDSATGRPASWAVVRVSIVGYGLRWGMADEAGRVVVQFPLPTIRPGFGRLSGSPSASPPGPPVADRVWDVALGVWWEVGRLAPLPGTDLPDVAEVVRQAPADVLQSGASAPASEWLGTLSWEGELVASTTGSSRLTIVSQGSSP
jgi:hypothetical protein